MLPILGRTPFGFIYSFTVVWGAALVLVYFSTLRRNSERADGLLAALIGGLIAGRILFVAANQAYFQENLSEIWQLGRGGTAYFGVLLGSIGAYGFWSRRRGLPFEENPGLLALTTAMLHAAGWLACWLEGCGYGRETALAWYAADLPDAFGVPAVRIQTQLAGLLLAGLVGGLAWRGRWPFWPTLAALLIVQALVSLGRGDPVPELVGWRIDTLAAWSSALLIVLARLASRLMRPDRPGGDE